MLGKLGNNIFRLVEDGIYHLHNIFSRGVLNFHGRLAAVFYHVRVIGQLGKAIS